MILTMKYLRAIFNCRTSGVNAVRLPKATYDVVNEYDYNKPMVHSEEPQLINYVGR